MPRDAFDFWSDYFGARPLVAVCAGLGALLGLGCGIWLTVVHDSAFPRSAPLIVFGMTCGGILLGLTIGVVVATVVAVLSDRHDRAAKKAKSSAS